MAATLGLVFGLGPCLFACLPFLAPVFLANDIGVGRSWRVLLPHALGRLTAYGGLGFAAGHAGRMAVTETGEPVVRCLLGAAALTLGVALLLRPRGCGVGPSRDVAPLRRLGSTRLGLLPGGLYLLGLGTALSPCAPLGVVLLAAALAADGSHGLALGLAFGLGSVLIPTLAYGLGFAYFSQGLRERLGRWQPRVEMLSATLLLMAGAGQMLRA